jgi:hypothetical protein
MAKKQNPGEGVTHKIWEEQEAPDEEDAEAIANWKKFVHL